MRKLKQVGVTEFLHFLRDARERPEGPPEVPRHLLWNPRTSDNVIGAPEELEVFEEPIPAYHLAHYLNKQFIHVPEEEIEGRDGLGDPGFWAGLALLYFELLTPGYSAGKGKLKADNRYVPETDSLFAGVRYYRHLIAGPFRLYRAHKEWSQPLLLSSAHQTSELYSQITDSAFYTQTRCLIEAVSLLYFDRANCRLKPGYNSRKTAGSLPRLLAVVDQLDLTYDLLAIDGKALVSRLPEEFDGWRQTAPDLLIEA